MNLVITIILILILFILLRIILNVEKKYLKYKKEFKYNDKKIKNDLPSFNELQDKLFRFISNLYKKYQKYSEEVKFEEISHQNVLPSLSILKEKTIKKKNFLITKFKKLNKNDPFLSSLIIIFLGPIFLVGVLILLFNLSTSQIGTYTYSYDGKGNKVTTKILAKPKKSNKPIGVAGEFYDQRKQLNKIKRRRLKKNEELWNSAQYYKDSSRYGQKRFLLKKVSFDKYILIEMNGSASDNFTIKFWFERFEILAKLKTGEYSNLDLTDSDVRMRYQKRFSLNKWNGSFQITNKNNQLIYWTKNKDGIIKRQFLGRKR